MNSQIIRPGPYYRYFTKKWFMRFETSRLELGNEILHRLVAFSFKITKLLTNLLINGCYTKKYQVYVLSILRMSSDHKRIVIHRLFPHMRE